MALCKAVSTPMQKNASALLKDDVEPALDVSYGEVICRLLYFFMFTRPDISYAALT